MTSPHPDAHTSSEITGIGRFRRYGQGEAVLILSNPQADPEWWAQSAVASLVAGGYQAITFVHTGKHYTPPGVVRDVARLIEYLDVGPVRLMGWSQGAAIAQEVALARPELVSAAALIATYGRQNSIDTVLQEAWDALHTAGDELDPVRLAMLLLTGYPAHLLGDDSFLAPCLPSMREYTAKSAGDPGARQRSAEFIANYQDRLGALRQMRVPCLVLGFGQDTDTFVARAREVAAAIPGSTYLELPDAGHAAPVTDADRVMEPVLDFFAHHSRR
jgi:pimeloyl-ACP methyl ester carboxylesterase